MKLGMFALVICMVLLSFGAGGCTSYKDFSGNVYEWVNAPSGAKPIIYFNETVPSDYQLAPMVNAKVFIQDEDHSHKFTITSGAEGYFHLGTTVELAEDVIIDVSQTGYQNAVRQVNIEKDTSFYKFTVLLIPNR